MKSGYLRLGVFGLSFPSSLQQGPGPLLHFTGRFAGERDRQDPLRRRAMTDQFRDPMRHHPSLAGPRPGQHQHRPGKGPYRFTLG